MGSNFSHSEMEHIYEKRPDLKPLEIINIDLVIVDFLKLHDVDIMPISSNNIMPGVSTNALMGLAGGAALVFMNASLTGQQKTVTTQEWISWKQWAMGHPDWPSYKDKRKESIDIHNRKIAQLLENPDVINEMNKIIAALKDKEKSARRVFICCFLAFFIGLPVLLLVHEKLSKQRQYPSYKSEYPSLKIMDRPLM
jgi:hypothetical protein